MEEEGKAFNACFELPEGYEVQMMVLRDYPGGRKRRGLRMNIFRSRIWIGYQDEPEPLVHISQEHPTQREAVDACYRLLLSACKGAIESPLTLNEVERRVKLYFKDPAAAV